MNVQIDRSVFGDKLERRFGGKRAYADQSFDLLDEVYDKAQEWFDDELQHHPKDKDSPRDLRISLKRYICNNIDLSDSKRSFFVGSHIWVWIATQLITYIVKLLIEHYWEEIYSSVKKK